MTANQTYDEQSLLQRIIKSDEQAYAVLYRFHIDAIFYFIRKYISIEQDAEDITASVFQKLWLQRAILEPSRPLRPYLYTIARNLCLNHLKLSQRRTAREAEALRRLHQQEGNSFATHDFMEELMKEIDNSLKKLPPQAANIFTMAFLQGRSNREIAALLNINEHTVRNQKSHALKQLRLSFRSWLLFCQLF